MKHEEQERCINIDWLEVYALEPASLYPLNASFFRSHGYNVREREYGTRVWKEMFEILDEENNPVMEVRRNPASGDSSFQGLCPESCHLRLPNWILYQNNPVTFMMDFLVKHDYIFKRIYRIDIALDFTQFDSGDKPHKFVRRYLNGIYRKVYQCTVASHGDDEWNTIKWNSISWGAKGSMVSTKLYNKTKELEESKNSKPYIRTVWMMSGLIDNPVYISKNQDDGTSKHIDVWRLEFSLRSQCDGWIVIDTEQHHKQVKQHIPHRLSLFDSKDKLWQRFQDLCYHYFRFKYTEYADTDEKLSEEQLEQVNSDPDRPLKRKDRCRDKILFYFDRGHQFTQLTNVSPNEKQERTDNVLERRLRLFRESHSDNELRRACDVLLKEIDLTKLVNYSPKHNWKEARALQLTLARKINGDSRRIAEILEEILNMLNENSIF